MAFMRVFYLDKERGKYLALVELPNGDEILMAQVSMDELNSLRPKVNQEETG